MSGIIVFRLVLFQTLHPPTGSLIVMIDRQRGLELPVRTVVIAEIDEAVAVTKELSDLLRIVQMSWRQCRLKPVGIIEFTELLPGLLILRIEGLVEDSGQKSPSIAIAGFLRPNSGLSVCRAAVAITRNQLRFGSHWSFREHVIGLTVEAHGLFEITLVMLQTCLGNERLRIFYKSLSLGQLLFCKGRHASSRATSRHQGALAGHHQRTCHQRAKERFRGRARFHVRTEFGHGRN